MDAKLLSAMVGISNRHDLLRPGEEDLFRMKGNTPLFSSKT